MPKILSVAPMEGMTPFPMRLWLQMTSEPSFMTSPFLRVTQSCPGRELPSGFVPELLELRGNLPYRVIPQFITGDPIQFLRAAAFVPISISPMVEINCGCPSPNSLGKTAGSGMLADPNFFKKTITYLAEQLGPGRLAVKMRLGIEADVEFADLWQGIAHLPLARLTIHARTRADGYRGHARWGAIETAAQGTSIPVHASGDIWGLKSWQELQNVVPHCSGAMIGRGLLRNPWLILELNQGYHVKLEPLTFINALFTFLLLHNIWIKQPQKLIAKVRQGRLGKFCGANFSAWEKIVVELTQLEFGRPFLLLQPDFLQGHSISPVAFARLRLLWNYLRSSLPLDFSTTQISKTRNPQTFFEELFFASDALTHGVAPIELAHQPAWDAKFSGTRG